MGKKGKPTHRFLNFLKWLLITIISIVAVTYVVVFLGHKVFFKMPYESKPTITVISNGNLHLGAASHAQPKTTAEYIKVLARQVRDYNKKVPTLWPNNPEINQYVIAQDIKTKKAYLISPTGNYKEISSDELASYNAKGALDVNGGWARFKANGIEGAYLTIDSTAMNNYATFQRYEHLGTYEPFITYSHELFHAIPQEKWADSNFENRDLDERTNDIKGRRMRMKLHQQLTKAISDPENQDQHIKDALATYENYKQKDPTDYKNTLRSDRNEGTAFYYELKSCLYAGYPDQIKNETDLTNALTLLFKNDNPAYRDSGAVIEGYDIGAFAGILLDRIAKQKGESPDNWKEKLMKNGDTTPLTLLVDEYKNTSLPKAAKVPTTDQLNKWTAKGDKVQQRGNKASNTFQFLYDTLY